MRDAEQPQPTEVGQEIEQEAREATERMPESTTKVNEEEVAKKITAATALLTETLKSGNVRDVVAAAQLLREERSKLFRTYSALTPDEPDLRDLPILGPVLKDSDAADKTYEEFIETHHA